MNKALQFRLAFWMSLLAVGTILPAAGQTIKPWESYGVNGEGVTLEIGPGKNWAWIAIANVRLDAAHASRITVVADALTPKTRWYLKLTCDLLKDGRITGGPDDLSPFDVKTTTGTFTCDLGALWAKNFPGQKQIDVRYIQIGIEGSPGSRVHVAKITVE